MRVRVLGPLAVTDEHDQPLRLGPPKQRTLLAFLLVRAGTVVPASVLLSEVWDHDPPNSGLPNLRMYAANLRRLLEPGRVPLLCGVAGPGT